MSKPPLVSIIILNYNGKNFIGECLDSVLKTNYPNFEVVVIDNGSTDRPRKYLKNFQPKLKVIFSRHNLYFTGGNNLGAQKAKGKYLAFLNSDTVVDKNWLQELVSFAQNHPHSLVQPKILHFRQKDMIDNVGGNYNFFGFGIGRGREEKDVGQYNQDAQIDYANGTCFLIEKSFFEKLGGFDERFRYFYEDVDLSLRARKIGGKCWYVYKSAIYHKGGLSFKDRVSKPKILYYSLRNRFLVLIKRIFSALPS